MGATHKQMHIDKMLSEFAVNYKPEGFIADTIFPTVNVQKQSDMYATFSRADKLRDENTKRASGTEARRIDLSIGSDTYYASNYALKYGVTIEDKVNADPIFIQQLINARAEFIMDKLLLNMEKRVANLVTSGSNVGSYTAVASGWGGAGDPLGNLNAAIDNVHYSNGLMPNKIVMGVEAWKSFRRDSTVRNLIFGTNNGGGYPNTAQAAALLDVEQILVGGAFQNTGGEGQDESLSSIWADNVLIMYAPPSPSIERPSLGYNLRWSGAGLPNMQAERHPFNSRTHSEEVEIGYYQDEKIVSPSYGFLLTAVNSST